MASKKKNKSPVQWVILVQLTLAEGLDMINDAHLKKSKGIDEKVIVHGEKVMRDRNRWAVLLQRDLSCFACGCEATHFQIERHKNDLVMGFSLNAYAGHQLLTWDHIIPRSLCGSDHYLNGRLACEACNGRRGNMMTLQELLWVNKQDPNSVYRPKWAETPAPLKLLIKDAKWNVKGYTDSVAQTLKRGTIHPFYGQSLNDSVNERKTYAGDASNGGSKSSYHLEEHESRPEGTVCVD
jgi:5-methylcytosine-specific restriction endonuclease McrA